MNWDLSDEEMEKVMEACEEDPVVHLTEVQGVEVIEDFQARLARAVWEHERVVVKSCHDMGKTWTMSKIVLAAGNVFPGCKIVTTAPTGRQVRLLLWSEIRAGHAASRYPLGGKMDQMKWVFGPDWWAEGFTTQKNSGEGQGQTSSSFQGVHSPVLVLVIFDEATGVPPDIWNQLEGLLTSANVKFVAIGNPTTKNSPFYQCFSDPSYKKLHFSCFDSPNLIANGIVDRSALEAELEKLNELDEEERYKRLATYEVVRPHLLTTRWVMGRALKWGLDHPLFVSKVLGEFPEEDESCLMPLGIIEAAQRRKHAEPTQLEELFIGVDVARKGNDKCVLTRLRGPVHKATKVLIKRDATVLQGAIIRMVEDLPMEERLKGGVITIDGTGIGGPVIDHLRAYQANHLEWRNIRIVEFNAGETWKEERDGTKQACEERAKKYANKKAEAFVLLAEALKEDLVLKEEDIYLEELPTILYNYDKKGRWLIEDKDAYKKRTRRGSPDHADSLSLANYGRYYSGGVGHFTADMAKPNGRPRVG